MFIGSEKLTTKKSSQNRPGILHHSCWLYLRRDNPALGHMTDLSQGSTYEVCCGQSGFEKGLSSQQFCFPPVNYHFTNAAYKFIRHLWQEQ